MLLTVNVGQKTTTSVQLRQLMMAFYFLGKLQKYIRYVNCKFIISLWSHGTVVLSSGCRFSLD